MKHLIKAIALWMILIIASAAYIPVAADSIDEFDPEKPCSVTITLKTEMQQAVGGAELTVFHIANVVVSEDGVHYALTEDFADCPVPLDNPESPELAESLYPYVQSKQLQGVSKFTDSNGIALFEGLHAGLYLFTETGKIGNFTAIKPFLVSLPYVSDGQIFYDSEAKPKLTVDRSVSLKVRKVWNDNGSKRPKNVTVQVMRGEKVFETVVLSEKNNWSVIWECLVYADDWHIREVNVPAGYTATYSQEGMLFTVTNTENLIQTGQNERPIPYLAGGGLLLMLIGYALIRSGRKQPNEKG